MKARTVGVHAGTPVVVALEVVALVAFIGLPPARFGWWPAAVITAVALLLLVPTVHRRNVPGWLATVRRWRRSRRGKYPAAAAAVDVPHGNIVCGVRVEAYEALTMIEVTGKPYSLTFLRGSTVSLTRNLLPLEVLTELLDQPGGIQLAAIDVVPAGHRVRRGNEYPPLYSTLLADRPAAGQRTMQFVVRLDIRNSVPGLQYRQSVGAAAAATERIINALLERDIRATALTAAELDTLFTVDTLAGLQTKCEDKGDHYLINGQKVWTTGAHVSHFMIALVRTEAGSERQQGLSQLVVPMDAPGVSVKPIIDLTGAHEFNEVFFDEVRLPANALLGTEGEGWKQATAELSLERSGPERYLSSMALFLELVRFAGTSGDSALRDLVGRLAAEAWTLRLMSASVAAKLARREDPALEATMVKDLGNSYEQAIPPLVQAAVDFTDPDAEVLRAVCFYLLQVSPSFSLRGGTREIIKGIIARGLGLR